MECLKIYISNVQEYFALLEKQISKSEELLKRSVKPCSSITNQCLILHSVVKKNSLEGTGLEKFPDLAQLLRDSILQSVNEQIETLFYIRNEIGILGRDLHEKYKRIENSFDQLKQENLLQSSLLNPISPRLEHITDWCLNAWRYYHLLYLQLSIPLETLDLESKESVKSLTESFSENKNIKEELNRIRSYELQSFPFIN